MISPNNIKAANAIDVTLGTGGVTTWAWWPYVEGPVAAFMLFGGAVLLCLRILISLEEYKQKRAKRGADS